MLFDKELKAFVPTTKPHEAKAFYRDTLGLMFLSEDELGLEFRANGILVNVIKVHELKPQYFTVLGWNVKDISAMIKLLNKKGILCERYDTLQQDSLGVWSAPGGSKVAWFKDPDGNVLSITEHHGK